MNKEEKKQKEEAHFVRPPTSQLEGQSALAVEQELRAKLKKLVKLGLEADEDEDSGVRTPKSEATSVDSFMQRDPRNEHFSFKKLRLE